VVTVPAASAARQPAGGLAARPNRRR
jgi:hypothetical protein